jgi:hypothetical protein
MRDLVLISCTGRDDGGERILELAQWMGVPTSELVVGEHSTKDDLVRELEGRRRAIVLSAETLTFLRDRLSDAPLQRFIDEVCAQLLVFSIREAAHCADLFNWLTSGGVIGASQSEQAHTFRFPESGRAISGPFAGQSFAAKRSLALPTFTLSAAETAGVESLLLANECPIFLRARRQACELFLFGTDQLPDINERLNTSSGVEDHYARLLPLLIFLRHSFGDMCWHGVGSTAHLIVDDPLLDPTYGYLSYAALKQSMRATGYASSIAFIPWNHWRTSKAKAAQALGRDENLSICVHGCDHTNREFDDLDPGSLEWKAATALDRLERHKLRTGVPFDPVMVFPQGEFASPALAALRTSGYLAAVNTTCFPTNAADAPITIADVLRPAITKFDGFPLFQRRYPRRFVDFAFDAFLGRPLLIVQHHDDFRNGYDSMEAFVDGLRKIEPNLTWPPLASQLMQSCMVRSLGQQSSEVRFFTSQFRFKNDTSRTSIAFSKEEPDPSTVSSVLVNGEHVPFSFQNGFLTVEHQAKSGQTVDIAICDRPRTPALTSRQFGLTHVAGVCVRRALSELRDKALVKHPGILAGATKIARCLKVTGDSKR